MANELTTVKLNVSPLNRVEGDLEIKAHLEQNKVVQAEAMATMFRGIEVILRGKSPLDPLVITPRICGICGQAHLRAAVNALENAYRVAPTPNATLIRNICQATENVQSHATWFYALFAVDFVNEKYAKSPFYEEVKKRFAPFTGTSYTQAVKIRKRLLNVNAIFSGQWPHSSYMVPGGVTCSPYLTDITKTFAILKEFQQYVETVILGCSLERWLKIRGKHELELWLKESEAHRNSDLGLFIQFGLDVGLDRLGVGPGKFLSSGVYEDFDNPRNYNVEERSCWLPAGYYDGGKTHAFDHLKVEEFIAHSFYKGYEGGRHPWEGVTDPNYTENDKEKYSFAKSPRYDGQVVEVGPLARMVVDHDPLILDLLETFGPGVFIRAIARFQETARTIPKMFEWLQTVDLKQPFYSKPQAEPEQARGVGLTEAARGSLMHWNVLETGKIANYQVITPTAWNVSPRDSMNQPGAIEQALLGTEVANMENPTELGSIVRSFDACLVCTVHSIHQSHVHKIRLGI
ncbi:nickel-dependent hydrogenase large subunit [Paenibacillus thalictri]|uniref:Cytochrome-c3 hydrogenase n=1 Tax=Paenibacillus thalictri TaxID=2527873 RepID=A0A4Q9DYI0_9BACL|nr:nickel-dependent hydrogenase large subunit [Paenibacillus thalictri]TBL80300.1 cytochrome-c3 hydrogenase [Paenibacillus thalictri]